MRTNSIKNIIKSWHKNNSHITINDYSYKINIEWDNNVLWNHSDININIGNDSNLR